MSYHIIVNLPSNRDYKGTLKMYNGSGALVFGPVEALGRGSECPDHTNWMETNGDTPIGEYNASELEVI